MMRGLVAQVEREGFGIVDGLVCRLMARWVSQWL